MTEWAIRCGLGALIIASVAALVILIPKAIRDENGWRS